jgi:hypothetical protein
MIKKILNKFGYISKSELASFQEKTKNNNLEIQTQPFYLDIEDKKQGVIEEQKEIIVKQLKAAVIGQLFNYIEIESIELPTKEMKIIAKISVLKSIN